jgi:hypothetical protein
MVLFLARLCDRSETAAVKVKQMTDANDLTKLSCLAKAKECRDMAAAKENKAQRIMLDHIADT